MQWRLKWMFLALLLGMASCREEIKTVPVPDDVLSPDSMVSVLKDLHLIESGINGHFFQSNNIVSDRAVLRELVFSKHRLESKDFFKSMDFYSANPEHLDSVYQKVIVELSKLQTGD